MSEKTYHILFSALPFIFFLGGYFGMSKWSDQMRITTPSIVGIQVIQALDILSDHHVHMHILSYKEDTDLPEGTIIHQTPAAGQKIKAHQILYVVVSRKPALARARSWYGLDIEQVKQDAQKYQLHAYPLEHTAAVGRVLAQSAAPATEIKTSNFTVYYSAGTTPIRIMPSVIGHPVQEVTDALESLVDIVVIDAISGQEVEHAQDRMVTAQKPLAGTLVNTAKHCRVYLSV